MCGFDFCLRFVGLLRLFPSFSFLLLLGGAALQGVPAVALVNEHRDALEGLAEETSLMAVHLVRFHGNGACLHVVAAAVVVCSVALVA